jgi:hypothetical protein
VVDRWRFVGMHRRSGTSERRGFRDFPEAPFQRSPAKSRPRTQKGFRIEFERPADQPARAEGGDLSFSQTVLNFSTAPTSVMVHAIAKSSARQDTIIQLAFTLCEEGIWQS